MNNQPRRSARLSSQQIHQEQYLHRSGNLSAPNFAGNFSQPSSTSTSSHPSPITDEMHPPPPPSTPQQPQQPQHRLQIQPQFMSYQQQGSQMNAPLPSPSAAEMAPFFGRPHSQPNPFATQQMHPNYQGQQAYGNQQPQTNQQGQQHHLHPHINPMSKEYAAHTQGMSMNPGQMPPDFLAEAAKRAQVACMMRDFGDVSL